MLNSIVATTVNELVRRGITHPPVFYSANIDDGDELNKKLVQEYKDVIHYQF